MLVCSAWFATRLAILSNARSTERMAVSSASSFPANASSLRFSWGKSLQSCLLASLPGRLSGSQNTRGIKGSDWRGLLPFRWTDLTGYLRHLERTRLSRNATDSGFGVAEGTKNILCSTTHFERHRDCFCNWWIIWELTGLSGDSGLRDQVGNSNISENLNLQQYNQNSLRSRSEK